MPCDIQKASLWKRFAAALLDIILLAILATGFCALFSGFLKWDSHLDKVNQITVSYCQKYDLIYEMTQEELSAMSPEVQKAYQDNMDRLNKELQTNPTAYNEREIQANEALQKDTAAIKAYIDTTVVLLLMISLSLLASLLILEFAVPLLFREGRTVGKKVFSLCLVRQDSVRVKPQQIFIRTILGKFAIESMIPACVLIMLIMGFANAFTLLLLAALLVAQLAAMIFTKNNALLHDLLSATVVAEQSTQMIFASAEEVEAYRQKVIAERDSRRLY